MKTRNQHIHAAFRRQSVAQYSKPSVFWHVSLAGLIASVCLIVSIVVLFPGANGPFAVLASNLGFADPNTGVPHRFPKGQLEADAQTFVAALSWLMEPDVEPTLPATNRSAFPLAMTNHVAPALTSQIWCEPCVSFAASSNQPRSVSWETNLPARS